MRAAFGERPTARNDERVTCLVRPAARSDGIIAMSTGRERTVMHVRRDVHRLDRPPPGVSAAAGALVAVVSGVALRVAFPPPVFSEAPHA